MNIGPLEVILVTQSKVVETVKMTKYVYLSLLKIMQPLPTQFMSRRIDINHVISYYVDNTA